jgi:nitrogen fixation/metabolism regulation signal transduction histidine kinase
MGSPKTLFILIMVIFVGMMIVNVNSIISGIGEHNTIRIVIASASSVIMVIPVVLILIRLSRIKKQQQNGKK